MTMIIARATSLDTVLIDWKSYHVTQSWDHVTPTFAYEDEAYDYDHTKGGQFGPRDHRLHLGRPFNVDTVDAYK